MSYFINWAIKNEYYTNNNPFQLAKLPENNQREVKLAQSQVKELLDAAYQIDSNLFIVSLIALLTGMRRGEIFSLTWDEVDLGKSRIILSRLKTKSKKARIIPIVPTLNKILCMMQSAHPDAEYVVHDFTVHMLRKKWNKMLKLISFSRLNDGTKLRFHDLRHMYAQLLLDLGTELEDIQFLLGHQSFQTTQNRYAMFARPDLLEKASKIDSIIGDSLIQKSDGRFIDGQYMVNEDTAGKKKAV